MRGPVLQLRQQRRETLQRFLGLNRGAVVSPGEFSQMENLSAEEYPVLSCRRSRQLCAAPASPQGLIGKDSLCYVDGADFVIGEERFPMGLSVLPEMCPKQLVSMGAYVIILPDKMYINTADPSDRGSIEAAVTVSGVQLTLCREDGQGYEGASAQKEAPEQPQNGQLWLDTGSVPNALRQYSQAQGEWVGISSTYVKISAPGIGTPFRRLDGVRISGFSQSELNGSRVIWAAEENSIVVEGLLAQAVTETGAVTIERRMPKLDLVVQGENRLWGCRYGPDREGNRVNQLYACALGDFKNWERFLGLSSDSYQASCGADGPFTGAAVLGGTPLFFRENGVHRIYGSSPASFRVVTQPCNGVKKGCENSLALVGDRLLYRGSTGFCAYDGSGAVEISRALGAEQITACTAGAVGERYYVCGKKADAWEVLVYSQSLGLWHREDDAHFSAFAAVGDRLYGLDAGSRNILCLTSDEKGDEAVEWMAKTGPLGLSAQRERVSRITLRVQVAPGAVLEAFARYDSQGEWEKLATVFGTGMKSLFVPLRPRRCDHMALMLRGRGEFRLYGITRVLEGGSER